MKMPENINKKNIAISAIYITLTLVVFTSIDLIYSMINKNYHYGMTRYLPIMIISLALIPKPRLRLGLYFLMLTMSFMQLVHFEYFGSLLRAIEFYSLFLGLNDVKESPICAPKGVLYHHASESSNRLLLDRSASTGLISLGSAINLISL